VATTTFEHGPTDVTAQALRITASDARMVLGCLYQPELMVLLCGLQKYQAVAIAVAALSADHDQLAAALPNAPRLRQHFFQLSVADRLLVLRDDLVAEHHDVRDCAGDQEQIVRQIYL
jgi:hypothetical protein